MSIEISVISIVHGHFCQEEWQVIYRLFYIKMLEEESDGLYIQDIMRGGIKNDDPRIPRNISA